jgi:diguanylate cyclase (GGDEF)-like protein/PAS domain S-box-containing protein
MRQWNSHAPGRSLSARNHAEQALEEQTSRLNRIIETQRDIAAVGLDLDAVMELICERTEELTRAESATILLLDGDAFVHTAATGFLRDDLGVRVPIDGSFCGWVYRNSRSALAGEMTPTIASTLARERGIRSVVAVPLRHGETTVGQLQVVSREPNAFTDDDVGTLELLSVVLSAAMSHAAEFDAKRDQLEALARFRTIFEGASVGIVRADTEGRLVEANPAMEHMLGYTSEELAAMSFQSYTHPDDVEHNVTLFQELLAGVRNWYQLEKRCYRKDGELIWMQVTAALERDADGMPRGAISTIEDITNRKAAEEALRLQAEVNEYQAMHDALTGLPNRSLFRDRIERAVLSAKRGDARVAVLMMDLDRFKEINDALGHFTGDALLREIAGRLRSVLRESDTVARLGGDEFGLLLPTKSAQVDVIAVIERIREALDQPVVLQDLPLAIEASIGVALFPDDGENVDTLLQRADVAMYTAKRENSAYSFYDEAADDYDPSRLTLVAELRRAIEERELVLYYQPKAVLATGEVRSVEALLRWNHPQRGLVMPDDFIPVAQQTGLIKPLTLYVVDEALRQCAAWQEEGLTLSIAVNLSMRNLLDVEFPAHVERLLDRWGVDPGLLEFEITESTMIADPIRTKLILDRLSSMGIRLSIDDFGTGYSSLAYLKRLPVNEIKIDRSFVMNMGVNEDDAAIVRSTIDLGRNLELEVVAEGVETAEVWEQLSSLGCASAQGYYLSRPVPPEDLRAWLRDRDADVAAREAA